MKRIEVKSKEYYISPIQEELILYTTDLNKEIVFSVFSANLWKVALARNLDQDQLIKLFKEINPDKTKISAMLVKV